MEVIDGKETYDVVNVSGGVQSTTLFWAIVNELLPRPDLCIFADTGWERASTYETIKGLQAKAAEIELPFVIVGNGNIRVQALESGNTNSDYGDWRDEQGYGFLKMPVYTIDQRGNKPRMSDKQCTTEFKIRPIRKYLQDTYGDYRTTRFNQWIGISLDETRRMRTSDVQYITMCYPLVTELKWSRSHCIEYLKSIDVPVPTKSACIGCPLHSDEHWHGLTESEQQDAIEFDESIRHLQAHYDVMPKPKKYHRDQLTLIDMNEVDDFVGMHPLERRQDVELYAHAWGIPLKDIIAGAAAPEWTYKQQELISVEDELGCGGNCFI